MSDEQNVTLTPYQEAMVANRAYIAAKVELHQASAALFEAQLQASIAGERFDGELVYALIARVQVAEDHHRYAEYGYKMALTKYHNASMGRDDTISDG